MEQDIGKIENCYNAVAREYAEFFAGEHEKKPQDQEQLKRFALQMRDRSPIWEFGCGPGHTAQYVTDLGIEISGLDLSEKILEQAQAAHPTISFRKGNMLDLDFSENSIAGVLSFYAIVHFTADQVLRAFQEIYRVLQPNGLYLFTYHIGEGTIHVEEFLGQHIDLNWMLFKSDFILSSLKQAGFESIEIIERDPYPDVEYQSRRAYAFATKPA
jgi:ubiquinone/menaquinone biosynthesis C-methylase UbiE